MTILCFYLFSFPLFKKRCEIFILPMLLPTLEISVTLGGPEDLNYRILWTCLWRLRLHTKILGNRTPSPPGISSHALLPCTILEQSGKCYFEVSSDSTDLSVILSVNC